MVAKKSKSKAKAVKTKIIKKKTGISRVFVTGCPRSGNTLILLLLAWGDKKWKRLHGEQFPKRQVNVIGKRPSDDGVAQVAEMLKKDSKLFVIWMVRDPRDTCVSVHAYNPEKKPMVSGAMWLQRAKQGLGFLSHDRVRMVRYEDLVVDPNGVQERLSKIIPLNIDKKWTDWNGEGINEETKDKGEAKNVKALGGVRPVQISRIGAYKETENGQKLALKLGANPEVREMAAKFGYEF